MARGKGSNSKAASQRSPVKKSAFASGGFKGSPLGNKPKDNRHVLFVEGLMNGVMVAWLKKWNKNEEPYLAYDMILLTGNPELCEKLGINAIIPRRGEDGITPLKQNPTSDYDWRQFIFILGEDGNTDVNRRVVANRLIDHMNKNAVLPNYHYPVKVRFGGDRTKTPMATISDHMMNKHVLSMMRSAYPAMTVGQLLADTDIMESFWNNVAYGISYLVENDNGSVIDSDDEDAGGEENDG